MASLKDVVWDPAPLTESQRSCTACVCCSKVYPRPLVCVGVLGEPGGGDVLPEADAGVVRERVYACEECAGHIADELAAAFPAADEAGS